MKVFRQRRTVAHETQANETARGSNDLEQANTLLLTVSVEQDQIEVVAVEREEGEVLVIEFCIFDKRSGQRVPIFCMEPAEIVVLGNAQRFCTTLVERLGEAVRSAAERDSTEGRYCREILPDVAFLFVL